MSTTALGRRRSQRFGSAWTLDMVKWLRRKVSDLGHKMGKLEMGGLERDANDLRGWVQGAGLCPGTPAGY